MSNQSKSPVVMAIVLVLTMTLGLVSARVFLPSDERPTPPKQVETIADQQMLAAIQDLTAKLHDLREALHAPERHLPNDRVHDREVTSPGTQNKSGSLETVLTELVSLLREAKTWTRAPVQVPYTTGAPSADKGFRALAALNIPDDHPDPTSAEQARSRAHFFWDVQRVLDEYGIPNRATLNDGGVAWWYEIEQLDSGGDSITRTCRFTFVDGYVINVD